MGKVSEIGKRVIDSIITNETNNSYKCSHLFCEYLKENCCLFIIEKDVYIFFDEQKKFDESMNFLTEFLIVIETLKSENLIYLIEGEKDNIFLKRGLKDHSVGILKNSTYQVDDGTIEIKKDGIIYNNLKCKKCSETISKKISDIIFDIILSTNSLNEFKENGYKSVEMLSLEKQIADAKESRNIAYVSLIISSVFAPIFSIILNNCHGENTIEKKQYFEITRKIDSCRNSIDKFHNDVLVIEAQYNKAKQNLDSCRAILKKIHNDVSIIRMHKRKSLQKVKQKDK